MEVSDDRKDNSVREIERKDSFDGSYRNLARVSIDSGPLESVVIGASKVVKVAKEENEASDQSPTTRERSASSPAKKLTYWGKSLWRTMSGKKITENAEPSNLQISTENLVQKREEGSSDDEEEPASPTSAAEDEAEETERKRWWSRWGAHIKYSIISKETEGAFKEVIAVLKTFFKDMDIRPIDITMCLLLLSTYHTCMTAIVRTDQRIKDPKVLRVLHHYMKYACSAYGWKLVYGYQWKKATKGFLQGMKNKKDSANKKILMELTGISEEDIIVTKWKSGHFSPGHIIAIDHSQKAVVLSIRGTFHAKDCLTDLIANYEPFLGGYAHAGILMAAKQLYKDLTPILLENLKKHEGYQLVIVGHSLGAGTAALFTMLMYSEYNIPVHCYAFASPGVVSLDLAKRMGALGLITTVVLNDDFICRLSYGSLEDLKQVIMHLLNQNESNTKRLFQFLSVGNTLGESVTKKLSGYFECSPRPDLGTKNIVLSPRLYPAGIVYHLFNSENKRGLLTKYDVMEESDPSLFGDIIISSTMFVDHMPDAYESALENLLDNLTQEQQQHN